MQTTTAKISVGLYGLLLTAASTLVMADGNKPTPNFLNKTPWNVTITANDASLNPSTLDSTMGGKRFGYDSNVTVPNGTKYTITLTNDTGKTCMMHATWNSADKSKLPFMYNTNAWGVGCKKFDDKYNVRLNQPTDSAILEIERVLPSSN